MNTVFNGEWIVDLEAGTCLNINTKMLVEFQKPDKNYLVNVKYMPSDTIKKWKRTWYGDMLIQNAVMAAERSFKKASGE
jgi:hypothetical protein